MSRPGPSEPAGRVEGPDPVFLATAAEIVLRAGAIQLSRRESGFRIDKKGLIDLVTEVDVECEQMCRAVIAEHMGAGHSHLAGGPSRARYS